MKKLSHFLFSVAVVLLLTGCIEKREKSNDAVVTEFAEEFGKLAQSGDLMKIKEYYPSATSATSATLSYNSADISIFPEDNGEYTIKYGQGASIRVRLGLNGAVEVVNSSGIFTFGGTPTGEGVASESSVAAAEAAAPQESVDDFASRLKKNIKVGDWEASGPFHTDDVNGDYGDCVVKVTNKNSFTIDGSDYYLSFSYEYLYAKDMYKEKVKKDGKTISAGGSTSFKYHYTDDCGPLRPKVHFKLTNQQLYDKYGSR